MFYNIIKIASKLFLISSIKFNLKILHILNHENILACVVAVGSSSTLILREASLRFDGFELFTSSLTNFFILKAPAACIADTSDFLPDKNLFVKSFLPIDSVTSFLSTFF